MGVPGPIITGTIVYLLVGAALIAFIMGARITGLMTKDNAAIGNVVISVAVFFSWLFWACAWLHQWHPLIKPIYEGE
eukprot:CAMPEP_0176480890 /NCGR_PEP_ID=MMETSP0200_2-20121128/2521_1 /TAXON_ID=947934 /ORGANISM="Chaetoceros sp., Strain GSL56" /LENGTH=76 /DNA_ID=CAMNT_0017877045 /DNA_START=86 /DNA_END=316 /DNA_ORIENTATION=+